jgi:hypothetical protein
MMLEDVVEDGSPSRPLAEVMRILALQKELDFEGGTPRLEDVAAGPGGRFEVLLRIERGMP